MNSIEGGIALDYSIRSYPQFSACGLNCGLCPRYHTDGSSKCPGCAGENFLSKHPTCGVLSCSQRKGFDYCWQCELYPCPKYDKADQSDSFITHRNQLLDLDKAKTYGMDAYQNNLNEKMTLLNFLLVHYNDGRRKGFYCLAVNLLDVEDIKNIVEQVNDEISPDATQKEKAAQMVACFHASAEKRQIDLRLRR